MGSQPWLHPNIQKKDSFSLLGVKSKYEEVLEILMGVP